MALYLVRWPDLRVSLIDARNEADLLQTIDEVESPSQCTWERYRGPLWVDFRFPADFHVEPTSEGPIKRHEVRPILTPQAMDGDLEPELPEYSDTASEMKDEILRLGFPRLASLFEEAEFDNDGRPILNREELRSEIVGEVLGHQSQIAFRGITIEYDGPSSYVLRRTETRYFRYRVSRFRPITGESIEAFCFGERSLTPDDLGKVRIVAVEVAFAKRRPVSARLCHARAFTTRANGLIVSAHAADAYDEKEREEAPPFFRRRNAAVRWRLSQRELEVLQATIDKQFGRHLKLKLPTDKSDEMPG